MNPKWSQILLIHIKLLLNSAYDLHMNPLLIPKSQPTRPHLFPPRRAVAALAVLAALAAASVPRKKSNWVYFLWFEIVTLR